MDKARGAVFVIARLSRLRSFLASQEHRESFEIYRFDVGFIVAAFLLSFPFIQNLWAQDNAGVDWE